MDRDGSYERGYRYDRSPLREDYSWQSRPDSQYEKEVKSSSRGKLNSCSPSLELQHQYEYGGAQKNPDEPISVLLTKSRHNEGECGMGD